MVEKRSAQRARAFGGGLGFAVYLIVSAALLLEFALRGYFDRSIVPHPGIWEK